MAKHTAKVILVVQSHMETPTHMRKMAMAQGVPLSAIPPGTAHASRNVEFYGEGTSVREALGVVLKALNEWVAQPALDIEPKQPEERELPIGIVSGPGHSEH